MNKKHINNVQTKTVDEHLKLLLKDNSVIDSEMNNVTPDDLPDWYDEKLYKEAQNLYKRNMLPMLVTGLVGLIAILSVTTILKVLVYTKRSSTPCAAFKRYLETIVHIHNMYTCDPNNSDSKMNEVQRNVQIYTENRTNLIKLLANLFELPSNYKNMLKETWYKTINVINWKHNINNKRSQKDGIGEIFQRDMVLTQLAFVAYVLIADKSIGLRHKPEEEEAFNHFWRVNGYMLGIPDRLNICRKTAKETRELCQRVINDVHTKYLNESSPEFYHMASVALDGLWYFNIAINKDAMLALTYRLHGIEYKGPLGWYSWLNMKYHDAIFYLYPVPYIGTVLRIYYNYLITFLIWLMQKWPLFAWTKFGKKNSQINLYPIY